MATPLYLIHPWLIFVLTIQAKQPPWLGGSGLNDTLILIVNVISYHGFVKKI